MARKRIGLREVRGLKAGQTIWDGAVAGFGARCQRSALPSYFLFYRTWEGRQRWHTIGRHGSPWTPETARAEAQRILGEVRKGEDPAAAKRARRRAANVSELCDLYLADAEAGRLLTRRKKAKKRSTLEIDKGRIERHIKPLLGRLKVTAVTTGDIDNFMHDVAEGKTASNTKSAKKRGLARVRGGKTTATRTVGLLGGVFSYAVQHRMRQDNPVRGVIRFEDGKRERRLTDDEFRALGEALLKADEANIWPAAVAASRFLALTGWRSGEALGLRWDEVDLARRTAILGDTKTGRSMRPLPSAACEILRNAMRSDSLVFPRTRGTGPMKGFRKLWNRIVRLRALPSDVTPNVLRHSFTSLGADMGYSDVTIGAIVGHKGRTTTSRYIHSADAVLLNAADSIANQVAALMAGDDTATKVIPLRRDVR